MIGRLLVVVLFASACGGGEGDPPEPDASIPTGFQPLITKTWTLPPGGENTNDLQVLTLDRTMFIGGIRPIAPPGTHHTVLATGTTAAANIIYASGVGTNELMFPAGVGLKLEEGELLALQLHTFNTTDAELTGLSGIEVLEVAEADVVEQAELLLAGPMDLAIPPGESTHTGTCTVRTPQTVFALFPHMHQLGTHLKTTLTVGGVDRVVHDGPYAFDDQAFLSIEPVALAAGDSVTTSCTWINPTSDTVTWGESSTTEMCFSILYRFPLSGTGLCDD